MYTTLTLIFFRHAKNEVLQNGRQLAFNLIETIQNEYSATYGSNHVAPPPNVAHQTSTVHIQQPILHQTIQTNNGQMQQINPGKRKICLLLIHTK